VAVAGGSPRNRLAAEGRTMALARP